MLDSAVASLFESLVAMSDSLRKQEKIGENQ
jgi:hypothetical protein